VSGGRRVVGGTAGPVTCFGMRLTPLLRFATAILWVGGAAPCVAQTSVVKPGATVRFRLASDDPYRQAQLLQITSDSLIVERCPLCYGRLRYGRVEVLRLEVSRRVASGSRVVTGVLVGGGVGLLAGVGSAASCHGGPKCDLAALAVPALGLLGAAFGGIGAYLSSYIWEPVTN